MVRNVACHARCGLHLMNEQDLPDVQGDRKYNISTFASRRGVKFTARAASAVLGLNYISAIVQGALSPGTPLVDDFTNQ